MDYDALVRFVQEHFTDGLALVIGSKGEDAFHYAPLCVVSRV